MNQEKKEIVGTITNLKDSLFWYNACSKCFTKILENGSGCLKCGNFISILRYRICFEVDTVVGLLHITVFGEPLNKCYGIEAPKFIQKNKLDEETIFLITKAIEKYFIGHTMVFLIKTNSDELTMETTHVAEDLYYVNGCGRHQTVLGYFEELLYFGESNFHNMKSGHVDCRTTNIFSLNNEPKSHTKENEPCGISSRHQKSLSDSFLFMQDSMNISLMNKQNWSGSVTDMNPASLNPSLPYDIRSETMSSKEKQTPSSCELLDNVTLPLVPSLRTSPSDQCDCVDTVKGCYCNSLKNECNLNSDSLVHESSHCEMDTSKVNHNIPVGKESNLSDVRSIDEPSQQFLKQLKNPKSFSTPKQNLLGRKKNFYNHVNSPEMFKNLSTDFPTSNVADCSLDLFSS